MANSIKFMNEGFEAKYGNIKPDLCEQIYTVLKRLTEANISPEDEADTKVLYRIYKKKMQNSNAELSPKELQVLDKYNLEEPRTSKDYRGRKDVRSSTRTDSEFRGPNVFEPVKRDGSINRKANLADRAKKMDARSNSRHDIGKYDKDYRLNYMYMKNAVNDKKYNQRKLDNLDKEYDQEESNLRARLNALKNEREQEKSRYNSAIKNNQYEINTLLKRESLDKLQEAISTLNERKQEWSDEDKVDSELLYSIYDKKLQRSNAALTPEEKAVLNKYNLGDVYPHKNGWGTKRASTVSAPLGLDVYEPIKRGQHIHSTETNRNVNLADRARKMRTRAYNKGAVGKYDRDFKYNYNTMKDNIRSRKYHQKNLDSLDKEYDEKEAKLLKQLDSLKKDREQSRKYHQGELDASNSHINKMLKRESLLSEDGDYDDYYGGNKEDFVSDLNDVEKSLESIRDSIVTHRAEQLVDDFLYNLDLNRKRASKVESLLSEDKLRGFNDGENLKHKINEFLKNLVIRWNHEYDIQLTRADLNNAYDYVMLHLSWDDLLDESFKKKIVESNTSSSPVHTLDSLEKDTYSSEPVIYGDSELIRFYYSDGDSIIVNPDRFTIDSYYAFNQLGNNSWEIYINTDSQEAYEPVQDDLSFEEVCEYLTTK